MKNHKFMNTVWDIIKEVGPVIVILTFIKATYEYIKGLKWKKSEFLSKEVKDFFSDKNVKVVCQLLDWNSRTVEIDGKIIKVDDSLLISALMTHNLKSHYTQEEAKLRDLFDQFFDKLSFFNIHIENNLVEKKEVFSYLGYYIDIISKPGRKPKKLVETFNSYIDYYGFDNIKSLLEKRNKKRFY